ncbi:MAG: MoxR family ATPase [Planctomycetes bacterium]|nr:MoxR family ATPase [Planctomycetota bacterium]
MLPRSDSIPADDVKGISDLSEKLLCIRSELKKRIVGQKEVVSQLLVALLARGHALMIGVPGLAKTLLVNSLAKTMDLRFSRIQFTPDLMPSDITGTEILEEESGGKRYFRFVRGPIFAHIVLADEINRTPPKTQAALLQAMQEYRVTCAGSDYTLDPPFFVLATQNPIEQEGTYPLPEAQLDRFLLSIHVTYPSWEEEREILFSTTTDMESELKPVLSGEEVLHFQRIVRRVPLSQHVGEYALRLVRATRPDSGDSPSYVQDWVAWGAGPRAAQHLVLAAKALTALEGRWGVTCEDVRRMLAPVLRHRVFTNFNADAEGITPAQVLEKIAGSVSEPSEKDYALQS